MEGYFLRQLSHWEGMGHLGMSCVEVGESGREWGTWECHVWKRVSLGGNESGMGWQAIAMHQFFTISHLKGEMSESGV